MRRSLIFSTNFSPLGPVPPTFDDFWRMVWEQQSSSIVMLTNLQERHKVKRCWPYLVHITISNKMRVEGTKRANVGMAKFQQIVQSTELLK